MIEPIYKKSQSYIKPQSFEIGKTTVYIRKDINKIKEGGIDLWTYQEAQLTKEEFTDYCNAFLFLNDLNQKEERLTIMEAIADIFDIISSK